MKKICNMDEITRRICGACDYLNNDIPISQKKTKCKSLNKFLECEIYLRTKGLESRIKFLKGEVGAVFFCGNGQLDIDCFEE